MDRRQFLAGGLVVAGTALTAPGVRAMALAGPALAGALDATELGLVPGAIDDQSRALQAALQAAAAEDRPLFLPPGRYLVAELTLPARTRLAGVAGATRLVHAGGTHFLLADGADYVELRDLVLDGDGRGLGEHVAAAVQLSSCAEVLIEGCAITGSAKSGLMLGRSAGTVRGNRIEGAADAGIHSVEGAGLSITDNVIRDCGNNGIVLFRWTEGEDGAIVTGNRIEAIGAVGGGTGWNGNGVFLVRAAGVTVAQNRITDCAFSAVRANASSSVQIAGNNCARLGETALYAEFAFEGAVIANNIVDVAANGISVANSPDGGRMAAVTGNIVRNLTGKGPYEPPPPGFGYGIYVEAEATVSGNVVDRAPLYGICLGWGPHRRNIAATGNVVRSAPIGFAVSVVEGVGPAVIANNLIAETPDGAVVGFRWAERATGDLAESSFEADPELTIAGNRVS